MSEPILTLCMIVKNEEPRIARCLDSVVNHVNKIVVADTGSEDGTKERIEVWAATHPEVEVDLYELPWEGDFSKARNDGLARVTTPWLLVLDADETLRPAANPLCKALASLPEDTNMMMLELYNLINSEGDVIETFIYSPRVFRTGKVHYENKVHNEPKVEPGTMTVSDYAITHSGYLDKAEREARKHERREGMIGEWIAESPTNYLACAYMAHALMGVEGREDEVVRLCYQAWSMASVAGVDPKLWPHFWYPLAGTLAQRGDMASLLNLRKDVGRLCPWWADLDYYIVRLAWAIGDAEKVILYGKEFLKKQRRIQEDPKLKLNFIGVENLSYGMTQRVRNFFLEASLMEPTKEVRPTEKVPRARKTNNSPWDGVDISTLMQGYLTKSNRQLAEELGRTEFAISQMLTRLRKKGVVK